MFHFINTYQFNENVQYVIPAGIHSGLSCPESFGKCKSVPDGYVPEFTTARMQDDCKYRK
jgi:hypothetical protein